MMRLRLGESLAVRDVNALDVSWAFMEPQFFKKMHLPNCIKNTPKTNKWHKEIAQVTHKYIATCNFLISSQPETMSKTCVQTTKWCVKIVLETPLFKGWMCEFSGVQICWLMIGGLVSQSSWRTSTSRRVSEGAKKRWYFTQIPWLKGTS